MIHGYSKDILSEAQCNLGFAFDYAVNHVGLDIDEFNNLFIISKIAEAFGSGSPKFVTGMSGTELVLEVFQQVNYAYIITPYEQMERTPEYWTGWILTYYQWYSGKSFEYIRNKVKASSVREMYYPLHEAPEEKFCDVMDEIISRKKTTNLQQIRKLRKLTQKQLSELSGVNLRTLQEYESGARDINNASGISINALAKVLCCNFYDVMEL